MSCCEDRETCSRDVPFNTPRLGRLWLRARGGQRPRCPQSFGVRDQERSLQDWSPVHWQLHPESRNDPVAQCGVFPSMGHPNSSFIRSTSCSPRHFLRLPDTGTFSSPHTLVDCCLSVFHYPSAPQPVAPFLPQVVVAPLRPTSAFTISDS